MFNADDIQWKRETKTERRRQTERERERKRESLVMSPRDPARVLPHLFPHLTTYEDWHAY